ncbi:MAG: GNAT family N-acetyltransferase [Rhodobiaceae bacterium]|nr:GNAT family N-acetyltransferase [Rhodobiaceae bacterium]
MTFTFRPIAPSDRQLIEELVRAYYAFDGLTYDTTLHGPALDQLVEGDPAVKIWIVESEGETAGYLILTIGFSMYYGGKDGFIDELFLKEAYRGQGGGAEIMRFADKQAKELGLAYLHLEVTEPNTRARGIYERRGFAPTGHILMSKRTAP